jgi:hypothetical protein
MSFLTVLETVEKDTTIAIEDVVKYVPKVATLAEVLFPSVAPEVASASSITVTVATMIQNAVLAIEAKYATAVAGDTTNAAKLADVLSIVEQPAIALLNTIGVVFNTTQVTNVINAVVAIFKNTAVPVTPSPASGNASANVVAVVESAVATA